MPEPWKPAELSAFTCARLTDACLTLLEPTPSCSSTCPATRRPFRIDVHGDNAETEVKAATGALQFLVDPFDGFKLRHLEKDIFSSPLRLPQQLLHSERGHQLRRARAAGEELTMIWPNWEAGFGDPYMWTLLPLGYALAQGQLPNTTLAISGAMYPKLYEPLRHTRQVCTFERNDTYRYPGHRPVQVVNPLPRCASACYSRIALCMPPHVEGARSWLGVTTLDALLGFPVPSLADARRSTDHGELNVLFARRDSPHGRSLLNIGALADGCDNVVLPLGWRLSCRVVVLGKLPLVQLVRLMRMTDVFVSMHGADVINGMHMLPGRTVLEVVNYGIHKAVEAPPWYFLSCFSRHLEPTFRHKRLVLPNPHENREPDFNEAWNRDAELPPRLFHRALRSIVREDGTAIMMDDSAILCGYPPGPANFTCSCGAVRPATGTECAVSLLEQHSRAPCTLGVSFGCYPGEPTRMWTRNCRGKFHCAGVHE